ncbi:odorant receptor 94a-like [Anoplophora glabripennis]|uniref:odorant receptor 94a-like n=1 Tax=Anoplophora glabripennis TaxID=217634 RepID=UPI000C75966B|nr:odorant receptor 94a-like [Anoplophora glabripennis]
MENFNLLDFFATEKLYLTVAGFYPAELSLSRYLYILSALVNLSTSWLQFLSLITFSYFSLNDLRKLSEILLFCMTQFAFLNKLTNLIWHKSSLKELEAMLQKTVFTSVRIEEKHILTNHLQGGKLLAKMYRVLCFLVVLFYALFPFLDERSDKGHTFPLPCWFPFNEGDYYYPVFFFEVWSIAISATVNSSIDVLTIMTMILATAEFKILNRKLTNIASYSGVDGDYDDDVEVRSRLGECIIHYDEALNLVRHIELTFSKGIFVQFFCSVMVICLTGFQMLVTFNTMDFIRAEKLYLTLTGFYPAEPGLRRYLFILSALVNLSISLLQFLSLITFAYFNLNDLRKVTDILVFCVTQFAFLNKLTNLIWHQSSLKELEALLQKPVFTSVRSEEKHIKTSHLQGGKLLGKMYRGMCFLGVVLYTLFPLLDKRSDKEPKFPLPGWFPFNEVDYYYPVFFFEILSIAILSVINSSIDLLTIMTMILATAEFKILNRKLTNISTSSGADGDYDDDDEVRSRMGECIIHYDEALNLVKHIELTFSKGIFVQFFCSVMAICFTGFQIIVIPFRSIRFVLLVAYLLVMMWQVAMYCWYGHNVMDSSDQVTSACYKTRWDKCSVEVRKSLMIVMERAKKLATIRAGNFFTLNIPTLMTILRSSYSYFALLQRVYGNN